MIRVWRDDVVASKTIKCLKTSGHQLTVSCQRRRVVLHEELRKSGYAALQSKEMKSERETIEDIINTATTS